ncbi:MAG: glycosyltransferase family 4 protein [Gaiellaceae bacterium]
MRVCLVYDCLYPYTVGGAERWYRNVGEHLAARGHEVTFLTRRQWDRDEVQVPGVRVLAVSPRMDLYDARGRRRFLPPLLFGLGVLRHLLRHGRRYDVVHTASFPYFSLLAAGAARKRGRYTLLVDWHEIWTRAYWQDYVGRLAGSIGWQVQQRCVRVPQRAFCFSRLHERRLRDLGLQGPLTRLEGQYTGRAARAPEPARPVVVFAGRHIPEKRIPALVSALTRMPDVGAEIYGDGPERERVLAAIRRDGLAERVAVAGFVDADVLEQALATSLCFVLPSQREGYGLVVIESAAHGVPSVVVDGPDNAATELVEDGTNGVIAASASAEDLANAITRVREAGTVLREATLDWFHRNAERLSLESSLQVVAAEYASADS